MTPYYADDSDLCACGCGGGVAANRRFITHHNLRVQGPRTDQHRANLARGARDAWATKRARKPLGSRRLDANGYWLVKVREGGVRWDKEHVLAVEADIGRRLTPGEEVHHLNAVKTDNRLENLLHCETKSAHAQVHASFAALLPELMEAGIVVFDHTERRYRRA